METTRLLTYIIILSSFVCVAQSGYVCDNVYFADLPVGDIKCRETFPEQTQDQFTYKYTIEHLAPLVFVFLAISPLIPTGVLQFIVLIAMLFIWVLSFTVLPGLMSLLTLGVIFGILLFTQPQKNENHEYTK